MASNDNLKRGVFTSALQPCIHSSFMFPTKGFSCVKNRRNGSSTGPLHIPAVGPSVTPRGPLIELGAPLQTYQGLSRYCARLCLYYWAYYRRGPKIFARIQPSRADPDVTFTHDLKSDSDCALFVYLLRLFIYLFNVCNDRPKGETHSASLYRPHSCSWLY